MAIHTIDTKTESPDVSSSVREGLGTNGISPTIEGEVSGKVITKNNQIITQGSDGVQNVLIGLQPDGTQGISVSQAGVDVSTADSSELVMSSGFNLLKVVGVITVSLYHAGTAGTASSSLTSHNLGYVPAYAAYVAGPNSTNYSSCPWWFLYGYPAATPFQINGIAFVTISDGDFKCNVGTAGGSVSAGYYNFKIYAFRETIT